MYRKEILMYRHYRNLLVLVLSLTLFFSTNVYAIPQAKPLKTLWKDGKEYYGVDPWKSSKEEYSTNPLSINWTTPSEDEVTPLSQNKVIYTLSSDKYVSQNILHLPWDMQVREIYPTFYEQGQYVDQGINSSDYHGTCGEAAMATIMNRMFKTNVYTENNILAFCSLLGTCQSQMDKWNNGGISPIQLVNSLNLIGNCTGDYVKSYYLCEEDTLNAEQTAAYLKEGKHIIMSVSSYVLYDCTEEEAASYGVTDYWLSNHWLVVTEPVYVNDVLVGFWLVDSSGYNHQYATLQKWNKMTLGPTGKEVIWPACVVAEPVNPVEVPSTTKQTKQYTLSENHTLQERSYAL